MWFHLEKGPYIYIYILCPPHQICLAMGSGRQLLFLLTKYYPFPCFFLQLVLKRKCKWRKFSTSTNPLWVMALWWVHHSGSVWCDVNTKWNFGSASSLCWPLEMLSHKRKRGLRCMSEELCIVRFLCRISFGTDPNLPTKGILGAYCCTAIGALHYGRIYNTESSVRSELNRCQKSAS